MNFKELEQILFKISSNLMRKSGEKVFRDECEKLGILYKMQDIVAAYKNGYYDKQISWF